MYRAIIYASDGTTKRTAFLESEMRNLQYVTEINKAGSAVFTIDADSVKATPANLTVYNRIRIYRDDVPKFTGYIEELQANLNEVTIRCIGLLGLLQKRRFSGSFINVPVATFVTNTIADINSPVSLNITEGINDSAGVIGSLAFARVTVFDMLARVADSQNLEFEINADQELNVTETIGTDKSATISFQYVKDRREMATVYDFDVTVSGKDMVNKLYGYSRQSGGFTTLTDDYEDSTSVGIYGLLEADENFSSAGTLSALTSEITASVEQTKDEFYTPDVTPNPEKIDESEYDLGDVVGTLFDNGFIQFSGNYRIIKKTVKVDDKGVPVPTLGLLPEGKNLLPSSFIEDIINLDKRIGRLEGTL